MSVEPAGGRAVGGRFSWLLVLVGGVVAYLVVLRVMTNTGNINFFPSLLLIGAVTVPVSVLVFATRGGRDGGIRTSWIVFTAVVGGLVGTVTAGLLEYRTLRNLGTVPMSSVGLIEEASKLVVPILLYLVVRPRDPRGGVIVGVASGMGFATLETMGYGFQALLSSRSLAAVDDTLLLRALLAPACHIAWTGVTVAMLWRIRGAERRGRAIAAFVGTYLVAVILHALWDGSQTVVVHLVVAAVGLAGLLTFIHQAHRDAPAPVAA